MFCLIRASNRFFILFRTALIFCSELPFSKFHYSFIVFSRIMSRLLHKARVLSFLNLFFVQDFMKSTTDPIYDSEKMKTICEYTLIIRKFCCYSNSHENLCPQAKFSKMSFAVVSGALLTHNFILNP